MRRSRIKERLFGPSSGAAVAAKSAEARGFKLGNRDVLGQLDKDSAAPEIAELEQAARAAPAPPAAADAGVGGAARAPHTPPDIPPTGVRAEALTGALGSARSVPPQVRAPMEQLLGRDLSGVEVFQGGAAAALAAQQNAEAFTLGEQIVMGGGFLPGTLFGDALLAHELAHVAHQSDGGPATSAPESRLEDEADLSAAALVAKLIGAGEGARELMRDAAPRARSGVRVQRCSKCDSCGKKKEGEEAVKKAKQTAQGNEKCPAGVESKQAGTVAESLKTKFGFSSVTAAEGSCWSLAELQKMQKAFGRMSKDQQAALEGVELRRVEAADCAGHSADGCFTSSMDASAEKRTDRLEMGDAAFAKDKDFDEGGAFILDGNGERIDLKPSEETLLHEAGHAIETAEARKAETSRVIADNAATKAQTDVQAAIAAYNAAFPAAGSLTFSSNAAEKAYQKSMIAWNQALMAVIKPADALGQIAGPALSDFGTASTSTDALVQDAKNKQAGVKAKIAKLPSGSSIRDSTWEAGLERTQQASENLAKALRARRDAQKTLEKAQAAERAVNAAIKLGGASAPTGMSRRLADFVGLLHVRRVDPTAHHDKAPYGTDNWPNSPGELFADYYELSRTRPEILASIDPEIVNFFKDPIGVKGKALQAQVAAWIKRHS